MDVRPSNWRSFSKPSYGEKSRFCLFEMPAPEFATLLNVYIDEPDAGDPDRADRPVGLAFDCRPAHRDGKAGDLGSLAGLRTKGTLVCRTLGLRRTLTRYRSASCRGLSARSEERR